jgi:flagellar hook-length control protein FliK
MDWQVHLRLMPWRKSLPTAVTHTHTARAHQSNATSSASDASASTSTSQGSGGFKDFMESYLAGLEQDQSAGVTGTTPGGTNGILALMAKLGVTSGDDATATPDELAAAAKAKKAAEDANGVVVPVAMQPQQALGFANDGGLLETAAQKAISAVTNGTPGAGMVVNAVENVLSGSNAQTAAQAATTTATQAAAQAAAATSQATADTAAKAGDAADLAAKGVVSIVGKSVADASHTVANQTAPKADDAAANAAHVALTALQQSTNLATTPMSRTADIRAKLQATQIGAGKTSVSGAPESGATTGGTFGDLSASGTTGTPATVATNGLLDATAKQSTAPFGDKGPFADGKPQDQLALADKATDKSQLDTSSTSFSDRLNAQFNANLAGLNQGQTTQSPAQAGAMSQAVPYAAVASTLISHAKAGSSEFNIRLDPAGLGQIDVKMKVSSDGQVRAHLIVDQPATLDLMMRDRQHLQQQLDQAGFKTDSSSLQFSLRDQGHGSGQQQAWQQDTSSSRGQSRVTSLNDSTSQIPAAVYGRQSYVRSDAIDISI